MTDQDDSILRRCAFDEGASALQAGFHSVPVMQANPTLEAPWLLEFGEHVARAENARLTPILRALLAECARLRASLTELDGMLMDSTVVCRKCGDEETLQDSDMAFLTKQTLTAHEAEMRRLGSAE